MIVKIYRYKHIPIVESGLRKTYIVMLIRPRLPIAQMLDWELDKLTFVFALTLTNGIISNKPFIPFRDLVGNKRMT